MFDFTTGVILVYDVCLRFSKSITKPALMVGGESLKEGDSSRLDGSRDDPIGRNRSAAGDGSGTGYRRAIHIPLGHGPGIIAP